MKGVDIVGDGVIIIIIFRRLLSIFHRV